MEAGGKTFGTLSPKDNRIERVYNEEVWKTPHQLTIKLYLDHRPLWDVTGGTLCV